MNVKIGILIGLFIITSPVVALTVQQQHYQEQISSYNVKKMKNAFENIVKKHESDSEVLDLAAQILINHIPLNIKNEEDTLAWACSALGESKNTRYVALLSQIISGDASKKIKKYAKKAFKKTRTLSPADSYIPETVNLTKLHNTYKAQQRYTPSEQQILNIGNNNLFEIKLLSEQIYNGQTVTTKTSDLLAQFLSENNSNVTNNNADTLAWVCKALVKVEGARYLSILKGVINTTESRRVRGHCKKAIKSLKNKEETNSYKFGDININQQVKLIAK